MQSYTESNFFSGILSNLAYLTIYAIDYCQLPKLLNYATFERMPEKKNTFSQKFRLINKLNNNKLT